MLWCLYRGADKSLARPGRKEARKHVRDARGFNNIETRAVIKFPPPRQGKTPKDIHAILTATLVRFLPGRAKDLSAPLYARCKWIYNSRFLSAFVHQGSDVVKLTGCFTFVSRRDWHEKRLVYFFFFLVIAVLHLICYLVNGVTHS